MSNAEWRMTSFEIKNDEFWMTNEEFQRANVAAQKRPLSVIRCLNRLATDN
jgi:hypothetical protein